MLRVLVLIQLTLWASAVHAFFPWLPGYLCDEENNCEKQDKRGQPISLGAPLKKAATPAGSVTFKLSQRVSGANFRSSVGAARQADHLRRKKASLEVERALNHPAEVVKRDNKYAVVSASQPTQTNSVGVNQDGTDFSYFIEAGVGSASTPLYLLIDTGAGTSWAMGSGCQSTACGMHNSFGPDDSTTYKDSSHVFSIAYGSGSVAGTLAEDSISVAGLKVTMTFGIANTTSDDFTHFPFDGILGLSMNKGATDNFMASIKEDKLLGSNIFSVALSRTADGQNTGEITFGATNPDKYTGDITYTSVSSGSNGDWAVPMDGLSYDGKDAGITGRLAYIDTGTSYVFGPPDDVAAIHKAIPDASSSDGITFTAPCDTDLPITVTFSGVKYTMSRKDWLSAPSGSGVCTSNIYGHEVVKGSWLLGDLFLKNVYAVFDVDKTRIGFASRPVIVAPTSTSSSAVSSTTAPNPSETTSTDGDKPSKTTGTTITPVPSASSGTTGEVPGLSGHETSATAAGVAQTQSASATATHDSSGENLGSNKYAPIMCIVAAVVFMA